MISFGDLASRLALGISLAIISGVSVFTAAIVTQPNAVAYVAFAPAQHVVKRGETLTITASYRKNKDCGGYLIATLDDADPDGGRVIIAMQPLGDRRAGTEWSTKRRYLIPRDAAAGEAVLIETLVHYCRWRNDVTRSPEVKFAITE